MKFVKQSFVVVIFAVVHLYDHHCRQISSLIVLIGKLQLEINDFFNNTFY